MVSRTQTQVADAELDLAGFAEVPSESADHLRKLEPNIIPTEVGAFLLLEYLKAFTDLLERKDMKYGAPAGL